MKELSEREQLVSTIKEAQDEKLNYYKSDPQQKEIDKIIKTAVRKLKKKSPELEPGGTYTIEEFSDALGCAGLSESPKKKWLKQNSEGYYSHSIGQRVPEEQIELLKNIIGNNQGVYNYFNKYYDPFNMVVESKRERQEEVKSNNIYDRMCAKTITHFKGSFQVKWTFNGEPLTITNEWSKNTTLDRGDVYRFMSM